MTLYRITTAWGDATIECDAHDTVVAIDPPTTASRRQTLSIDDAPPAVRDTGERIRRYFDGDAVQLADTASVERALDAAGIEGFHRDVLIALSTVPAGATITYGELAARAGRPRAARAAGTACGRNPLPIVVPCHRVLPASGGVGNFGFYGPDYKRRLLDHERPSR